MSARTCLLLAGAFQLVVAAVGFLGPGSILAYPFSTDASEPITVVYNFPHGRLVIFFTLLLLGAGFLACLGAAARLKLRHAVALVVASAIPLVAVFTFAYPTGSADIFHNMADARIMWTYHELPIVTPPAAHPDDPIVRYVRAWRDVTSRYGPLAYVSAGVPSLLAGDDLLPNLVWFKAYNGALLLVLACLVGWAARVLSPGREAAAAAMIAWNPLLLYETVANGHNDVLMAIFAVVALVLAWREKRATSFLVLALGAGVKFVTALLAPLTWAWFWLNGERRDRAILATFGLATLIVGTVVYELFGDRILGGPGPTVGQGVVGSPVSILVYAFEPWLGVPTSISLARAICFVVFGVIVMGSLGRLRRPPRSLWVAWVWTLFGLVLLTATQVYPWYLMWAIPIAAIGPGTRESDVAVLSSVGGLLSYAFWPWQPVELVDGAVHPNVLFNFIFVVAFFGIPAAYLLLAERLHLPTTATLFGYARPDRSAATTALAESTA